MLLQRLPENEVFRRVACNFLIGRLNGRSKTQLDSSRLDDRLLKDRIVFLGTPIDDDAAHRVIGQLLFLESEDPDSDAFLYINSPGGSITAMLAIIDTINYVRMDVATVCVGQAAGAAVLILAAGEKGKRYALPNARLMLGPLHGGTPMPGVEIDVEIQAREILRLTKIFQEKLATFTGGTMEGAVAAMQKDTFFSTDEARRFGLFDSVFLRHQLKETRR